MAVYKMKSGIWRIQFHINGRNYVKSSKTTNKKVAELMEAKWKTEVHAQKFLGDKEEISVQTLIDNYLVLPLAETTIKNATVFFRRFTQEVNCDVNASEFRQAEVEQFVQKRLREGISQATLRTQLLYFSGAWNDGNKDIYNIPNLKLPQLKKSPMKTEYLSDKDEQKLFDYLHNRLDKGSGAGDFKGEVEDIFKVLIDTGLRHNELCRLEWSRIDLNAKTIDVFRKKTGTSTKLQMTNRVHEVLQRRFENKKHEKWVFTNEAMDDHRRDATTYLNEVLYKAGLPYTVHQLRHTTASQLLARGMTLAEIKEILGHSSIVTTSRYAHLEANSASKKAAEVLNSRNVENSRKGLKIV
jgi:integrase